MLWKSLFFGTAYILQLYTGTCFTFITVHRREKIKQRADIPLLVSLKKILGERNCSTLNVYLIVPNVRKINLNPTDARLF